MTGLFIRTNGSVTPAVIAHFAFDIGFALATAGGHQLVTVVPLFAVVSVLMPTIAVAAVLAGPLAPTEVPL